MVVCETTFFYAFFYRIEMNSKQIVTAERRIL